MIELDKQKETVHNAINTLFDIAKVQKAEIDLLNVDIANKQSEINDLKAKLEAAQVHEGFALVPKEFNEKLAEKMAAEMVNKPIPENDPVWIEIANKAYKDNLLMKKWEIIRNYKAMIEAAQGEGHE